MGTLKGITGGTFYNGTANVAVSSFRMMRYDVTRSMYNTVIGSDPSIASYSTGSSDPVQTVNWYNTLVFCNSLSISEGLTPVYKVGGSTNPAVWGAVPTTTNTTWDAVTMNMTANGYRLPTEAEYMWAAMGGLNDGSSGDTVGSINTGGYTKGCLLYTSDAADE